MQLEEVVQSAKLFAEARILANAINTLRGRKTHERTKKETDARVGLSTISVEITLAVYDEVTRAGRQLQQTYVEKSVMLDLAAPVRRAPPWSASRRMLRAPSGRCCE